MKSTELTKDQIDGFSRLLGRLSPENLHCDGEISRAQAARRKKQILLEWGLLELEAGRRVTEDEIFAGEGNRS